MSALFLAATMPEWMLFWPLALVTVGGALAVLIARNPMTAVISLVLAFFGIAGLYVLLVAQLVAAIQIIVYAGAIMVLFLFVIMLLSLSEKDVGVERLTGGRLAGGLAVGLFAGMAAVIFLELPDQQSFGSLPRTFGTVEGVGRTIFTEFILPFEATSILLLVAIVGAVVVAKAKI